MPPIRSLHINDQTTWRGGERQTLFLIKGLRERGHTAELVARPSSAIGERASADGIAVHTVRMRGEADFFSARRIARIIREGKFDVVHMHTAHAHMLGCLACAFDPEPLCVVSRRVVFPVKKHALSLSRLKYSFRVNHYIAISGAVRDTLIEGGVGPEKISIVHSGVEPPGVKEGGESDIDLRAELGISPGDRIVATVGALARNKGHRCLIEAAPLVMEKVPGARFVFFGEGGLRAELEALVSQSGLKNAIIFAGFRVEVNALLKQVDVVAAPSHMEGLNTSIVDALMAERPVVATRVGGIPEIIEDGATGLLVPPKDAESLAGAIVELLENPEKASQLASAGKKAALEKFTTDRMVDGTVAVYEELLKDR